MTEEHFDALTEGTFIKQRENSKDMLDQSKTKRQALSKSEQGAHTSEVNNWLHMHQSFPLWRWGFQHYGLLLTFLVGGLALGLVPGLAILKWLVTKQSPKNLSS